MLAIMNNEIIGIFLSNQYHIRNGSICLNNHFRIALELTFFTGSGGINMGKAITSILPYITPIKVRLNTRYIKYI